MSVDATLKVPDSRFTKRHMKKYLKYKDYENDSKLFRSMSRKARGDGLEGQAVLCRGVEIGSFAKYEPRNPTIDKIEEITGKGWQKITDKFISEVKKAFKLPITADPYYKLNDVNEVIEFLEQHKGKPVFYMDM